MLRTIVGKNGKIIKIQFLVLNLNNNCLQYFHMFHMGIMWIRWYVYVKEQVVKSFNQIKQVNNLQRIIWRNTKPSYYMGIQWHVYVAEHVIKSVSQIKEVNISSEYSLGTQSQAN